jgi:hypothetical protein
MAEVTHYRNKMTGFQSQPHRIGTTEDGRGIYMALEGWEPLDEHGDAIDVEPDEKGTWII